MYMLNVEDLNVFYGQSHILFDVSMKVKPGRDCLLAWSKWCGKDNVVKGGYGASSGQ